MKRILLLALCICGFQWCDAQTVNQLFSSMSKQSSVTKISMNSTAMFFASLMTSTYGVDKIDVLCMEDCNPSMRESFRETMENMQDRDFETLVSVNDKGEKVKILVKIDDESISELVVLVLDTDITMVRLWGEINPKDIAQLSEEYGA